MSHFMQWGDPYEGQQEEKFEIGDTVRVKPSVPSYSGRLGKVIDLKYGCLVEFSDGTKHEYDEDMLIKVKKEPQAE
jgi:hypothetical protein